MGIDSAGHSFMLREDDRLDHMAYAHSEIELRDSDHNVLGHHRSDCHICEGFTDFQIVTDHLTTGCIY